MAAAVEQSGTFPESPNEEGDAIYPCKGCGEVRAFNKIISAETNTVRSWKKAKPLS